MRLAAVVALLTVLSGRAGASEPLRAAAERLSRAARRARVARVAVLPLEAGEGGTAAEGEMLADVLTGEVVRDGRVRVVERSRLADVMSERRLGAAGATAAVDAPLEAAEAVVTGRFTRTGARTEAALRLVDTRTGEVLGAVAETFDWDAPAAEASGPDGSWTIEVPAPVFDVAVPRLEEDGVALKDAPNDDDCADAPARVDRIVAGVLDLKARYWASELRKGFSPYAVTRNPGSEISDPGLKDRFYAEIKGWFGRPFVPELSRDEFERMRREDARAAAIASRCGI